MSRFHVSRGRHPVVLGIREARCIFFGPESHTAETMEPVDRSREQQQTNESMRMPETPDQKREFVQKLVDEAKRLVDAEHVVLQRTRAKLLMAQDIKDLPDQDRCRMQEALFMIDAQLAPDVAKVLRRFHAHIEVAAGSTRTMDLKDGQMKVKHTCSYGRVGDTVGRDGEPKDAYFGPNVAKATHVFVLNQGDENKYFLGFDSPSDAVDAYRENHPEKNAGDVETIESTIRALTLEEFAKECKVK